MHERMALDITDITEAKCITPLRFGQGYASYVVAVEGEVPMWL